MGLVAKCKQMNHYFFLLWYGMSTGVQMTKEGKGGKGSGGNDKWWQNSQQELPLQLARACPRHRHGRAYTRSDILYAAQPWS